MKDFKKGTLVRYTGSPKMIYDFKENENEMKVVKKFDDGNKTYPTHLWEVEYKGIVRLIMEENLQISE
jgi:hypothetical protein